MRKELKKAFEWMAKGERYLKLENIQEIAKEIEDDDGPEDLLNMWNYLDIGSDGYMSEDQFLNLIQNDLDHHM